MNIAGFMRQGKYRMSCEDRQKSFTDLAEEFHDEKNRILPATLYLVATPIGNLEDLSARALKVLRGVDFIAAEDTRNSAKLLHLFDIQKPLISYFEHNKRMRGEWIVKRLQNGESCALVTDAGTPAISDPGEDLVRLCRESNIPVYSIPGASAVITALSVSALPTSRFAFEGFLPVGNTERRQRLNEIRSLRHTIVLYEAPHRLKKTLEDLYAVLGDRLIAICRELTKLNEEVKRLPLSEAVSFYENTEPRGEYVLVVCGASDEDLKKEVFWSEMDEREHMEYYTALGMRKNDAIKAVARDRNLPKSEVYNRLCRSEK